MARALGQVRGVAFELTPGASREVRSMDPFRGGSGNPLSMKL
jgi:hypothetical protein